VEAKKLQLLKTKMRIVVSKGWAVEVGAEGLESGWLAGTGV
jgi:hypothetical protein